MRKLILVLFLTSTAYSADKITTYKRPNGSIQFRAIEGKHHILTYDAKGTFSGEYRKSGNSVVQTNKGFKSAKPGSTFRK